MDPDLPNPLAELADTLAADPAGTVTASPLDGNGNPSRGHLRQAVDIIPAVDRHGGTGGAVEFNGTSAKLQYDILLFPDEDYTAYAWIYILGFATKPYQQVFSAWCANMDDPLRISLVGNQLSARIEAGTGYATPGVPVEPNRWLHVAAIKSGDRLHLYINGQPRASAAVPRFVYSAARSFALGGNPNYAGDEYFHGRIDDFALHAVALLPEQIRSLYEAGQPQSPASSRSTARP